MFRVLICIVVVPRILGIIVKDPPPRNEYNYSYDIEDPTTGDTKSQYESRKGDVVTGSYSVVDPDGTKRTVQYKADSKNGFQAIVHTVPDNRYSVDPNNAFQDIVHTVPDSKHRYQVVVQAVPDNRYSVNPINDFQHTEPSSFQTEPKNRYPADSNHAFQGIIQTQSDNKFYVKSRADDFNNKYYDQRVDDSIPSHAQMLYTNAVPSPSSEASYQALTRTQKINKNKYVTVLFTPNDIDKAYRSFKHLAANPPLFVPRTEYTY